METQVARGQNTDAGVRRGGFSFLRILTVVAAVFAVYAAAQVALADTWVDPDTQIEWTYFPISAYEAYLGGESTAVPTNTSGAVTVPAELDGHVVTVIGDNAFFSSAAD